MAMAQSKGITFISTHKFLNTLFSEDVHAKRIYSLANATLGVISSASLAVNTIGQGLALARGRLTKHAIKQVDRLLSNQGIEIDELLMHWVPYAVGQRPNIVVAMDWTDFDADNQSTIMLSLISNHGRSTPLVWLTVDKTTLNLTVSQISAPRRCCDWSIATWTSRQASDERADQPSTHGWADSSLKGNTISPHWKGWCDGRRLHTTDGCGAGEDRAWTT